MDVKSVVKLDAGKIQLIDKAAKLALAQTADAIMTDVKTRQIMPFDTGTLQNDSTFVDDSGKNDGTVSIVSNTPYARRLYYHPEYNFNHQYNANASAEWFKDYQNGGSKKEFAEQAFKSFFKRNMGV